MVQTSCVIDQFKAVSRGTVVVHKRYSKITGECTNVTGQCSNITGECSNITGEYSNVIGQC